MSVTETLQAIRQKRVPLTTICAFAGIDRSYLQRCMRGERNLSPRLLARVQRSLTLLPAHRRQRDLDHMIAAAADVALLKRGFHRSAIFHERDAA